MFKNTPMAALLLAVAMLYSCHGIQGDRFSASRYEKLKQFTGDQRKQKIKQ